METLLITIAQFRNYFDLQKSYNSDRFDTYVKRVQRDYLREVLTPPLYYDFFKNISSNVNYQKLRDGEIYEYGGDDIEYFGIVPFLAYHIAVILVEEGEIQFTESGAHTYNNDYSQIAKRKDIIRRYGEQAIRYGNEIKQYLDEKNSNFPLWEGNRYVNPQSIGIAFI